MTTGLRVGFPHDPVTDLEKPRVRACLDDAPRELVPHNHRRPIGKFIVPHMDVGPANSTDLHFNEHLARTWSWLGNLAKLNETGTFLSFYHS
jgi:hypothetical protein